MFDIVGEYSLILATAITSLVIALYLLFRTNSKSSKSLYLVTIIAAIIALMPSVLRQLSAPETYAAVTCITSSEFVPSTIKCEVEHPRNSQVEWAVDGKLRESRNSTIELQIEEAGDTEILVKVTTTNVFRSSTSNAKSVITLSSPPPAEPEKIEVVKNFSRKAFEPRFYELRFPAETGYKIVEAKLLRGRGDNVISMDVIYSDAVATVRFKVRPDPHVRDFGVRWKPTTVNGSVLLVQEEVQAEQ